MISCLTQSVSPEKLMFCTEDIEHGYIFRTGGYLKETTALIRNSIRQGSPVTALVKYP